MSTEKRDRQRTNRESNRLVAAQQAKAQARQRRLVYGVVLVAIVAATWLVLTQLGGDDNTPTAGIDNATGTDALDAPQPSTSDASVAADDLESNADATGSEGCPAEDGSSPRTIDFDSPQPMCIDPSQTHVAVLDTSEGEVRVTLDTENTPLTTNNFVTLARWGYYDGTTIFRSDPGIDIIQGGAPHTESASDPGPGYSIVDEPEFELDETTGRVTGPYRYVPGQLVMARSGGPNAAGAQFFFTTGPNAALLDGQGSYVVFGTTDDVGLAVLQSIIGLHEEGGNLGGTPSRTVTINSVTIELS